MISAGILKDLAEELAPFLAEIFFKDPWLMEKFPWIGVQQMSQPSSKRVIDSRPAITDLSL